MINPRVLIVASSQHIDLTKGIAIWMDELAQPYYAFRDFTDSITLTSPNGITISIAGAAREPVKPTAFRQFSSEDVALAWIASAVPIHSLNPVDFDMLYIAGGDNSVADMEDCWPLTAILEEFVHEDKPIAAIGTGVTALLSVFMANGDPYVKGRKMTSYTNREVKSHSAQSAARISLESRLMAFGAAYSSNASNRCNVVKDGMLITGQNAASAAMSVLMLRSLSMAGIAAS
jgi:putative intracellular protease/amidase